MRRLRIQVRATRVLAVLVISTLGAHAPARAQDSDPWSFLISPQVWISHIAKNGFSSAPNSNVVGKFFIFNPETNTVDSNPFPTTDSSSVDGVNPQWGIQIAAQKGRLTLAGAFQYVSYETQNDVTFNTPRFCIPEGTSNFPGACITQGERWAQELIDTTRMDVDLSASYFFPDVVKDWLDVSLGGGFKFIHASASRHYANLNPVAAAFDDASPGLYTFCTQDNCLDGEGRKHVKQQTNLYAATFPMSATLHLTNDGRWRLPFSITPLLGAEHRNDNDIVYSITLPQNASQVTPGSGVVNRQDGTTFAYGVTADATLRWIINETFSAYAGMRVQYINGHDVYLAYGPLVGMSVRFGGK